MKEVEVDEKRVSNKLIERKWLLREDMKSTATAFASHSVNSS
jgi:hypothetical protein